MACESTSSNAPNPQPKTFSAHLEKVATKQAMVDPNPANPAPFLLHADIIRDLGTFRIKVKELNLLNNLTRKRATNEIIEYTSFQRDGYLCVRTIVRIYSGRADADFWVYVTFGHTGTSQVSFPREEMEIKLSNTKGSSSVLLDAPPKATDIIGHGQGLPLKYFKYNFTSDKITPTNEIKLLGRPTVIAPWFTVSIPPPWIKDFPKALVELRKPENKSFLPLEETPYVPSFPGRTGGQRQFGTYGVMPEIYGGAIFVDIWRKQLYQEGSRTGHFLHPDGTRVSDNDPRYDKLVAGSEFHKNSRGYKKQAWFKPTNYTWMGTTPNGGRWRHWNMQHWSLTTMCQVYILTQDPGLELLLEDLAENFLFANPAVEKGTTHHIPGSARGRGRVIESGASMYYALHDPAIKERLKKRINALVLLQMDSWDANGIVVRGGKEIAAWEHGIWVTGLAAAFHLVEDHALQLRMYHASIDIGKFVLKSFKYWENDKRWAIPYLLSVDQTTWSNSPSYGLSDWCLPCIQLLDRFGQPFLSIDQKTKLKTIITEYTTNRVPPDHKGYGNGFRWRLY